MTIAYVAHPISGDIEANLADLRRIIRKINLEYPNVLPFCPYYADVVSLDDNIPSERMRGIENDTALLQRGFIDEIWFTGSRISSGMQAEGELGKAKGIPIIDFIDRL